VSSSVLFLDAPRLKIGRETIAVSLDIAFPEVVLSLSVWGFASAAVASSSLPPVSSFDGKFVVILRREV
jgi:hypothetical protein